MKLYAVTNGWFNDIEVYCLVVAASQAEAVEAARQRFMEEALSREYPATYWETLAVNVLCEDLTRAWSSPVSVDFTSDDRLGDQ